MIICQGYELAIILTANASTTTLLGNGTLFVYVFLWADSNFKLFLAHLKL